MLKSEFIQKYSLLDCIKNTTGISGKERANIVRAKVAGSAIFAELKEEYGKLMEYDDVLDAESAIKHNQKLLDFRKRLSKEEVNFTPIKLNEKTFEALCGKLNTTNTLDLIIDAKEVTDDELLCYIYAAFVE